MDGITYYQLQSSYVGDVTKNCALKGQEVDNNFYVLEGRDIDSVTVSGNDIVITLLNGKQVTAVGALDGKVSSIEFDKTKGVLKVTKDGEVTELSGFATTYNSGNTVAVDGTLVGDGLPANPVGISPLAKTGVYSPVKKIVKIVDGESLPTSDTLLPGDRFVTAESVSNYGYLYNYNGIKQIACDLKSCSSSWRIPTKDDWDDMLNAIEPCETDKNHSSASTNVYLGKYAGKLLKSTDLWKPECCTTDCCGNCTSGSGTTASTDCNCVTGDDSVSCIDYSDCNCGDINGEKCNCTYCGEVSADQSCACCCGDNVGVDKYGFRVTPAGYMDDGNNYLYFRERACFWTATNQQCASAYTKRFEYNKSSVHQDVQAAQYYFSLRLVKDYDGTNFNEREDILGSPISTVLMPSAKNGHAIWTSVNVALGNKSYGPVLPNDGQGMTFSTHYYIDEWDGNKWLRNELKEGESVVVKTDPDGGVDKEYRVVNNELVSVDKVVYDEVKASVDSDITEINGRIDSEINRAISREESIEQKVAQINTTLFNDDTRLTTAEADIQSLKEKTDATDEHLTQVETTLTNFGTETQNAFAQLNNVITTSVNTINEAIEAERQTRESKDTELSGVINDEIIARTTKDGELAQKIDDEVSAEKTAREEKDTALDTKIDEKVEDLQSKIDAANAEIETTKTELTSEKSAREEADTMLQSNIDTVASDLETLKEEVESGSSAEDTHYKEVKKMVEDETAARESKDAEIEGKLITADGTTFDKEKGLLTLKSADGTNDIKVQFSGYYGTF